MINKYKYFFRFFPFSFHLCCDALFLSKVLEISKYYQKNTVLDIYQDISIVYSNHQYLWQFYAWYLFGEMFGQIYSPQDLLSLAHPWVGPWLINQFAQMYYFVASTRLLMVFTYHWIMGGIQIQEAKFLGSDWHKRGLSALRYLVWNVDPRYYWCAETYCLFLLRQSSQVSNNNLWS